jgi:hypothetical protein
MGTAYVSYLLLKWRRIEKRHKRIAPANGPSGKRPTEVLNPPEAILTRNMGFE